MDRSKESSQGLKHNHSTATASSFNSSRVLARRGTKSAVAANYTLSVDCSDQNWLLTELNGTLSSFSRALRGCEHLSMKLFRPMAP
mmetsp:Transcript_6940/g.19480  ORF Transcript_6940/g.19480 Transcript_6940/m.19480 type:complete len:86 (-) Transcript_6940:66-323(-)